MGRRLFRSCCLSSPYPPRPFGVLSMPLDGSVNGHSTPHWLPTAVLTVIYGASVTSISFPSACVWVGILTGVFVCGYVCTAFFVSVCLHGSLCASI